MTVVRPDPDSLYGLTTLQTCLYFQKSWKSDSWRLKAFVVFVWLLETAHVCLISSFLFHTLIIEYGNPAALLVTRVSDDVTTLITGFIILSVHLFYVRRLWILSGKTTYRLLIVGVVTTLAIVHFGLTVAVMVLTFKFPAFSQFHRITGYYTGSMAVAAADDMLIAGAMAHLLSIHRGGTRSTNTLVNRFITFSVATGALTSLVDLAILICFVAMPNNLVYLAMYNLVNNREMPRSFADDVTHSLRPAH
ncbi:hypothetical protein C8Q76DRAFT_715357 [Earliella scabrosa]|nr:hypothetical protein C8Q76DRAFT_715357 [Earliella scabrosa]